MWKFTSIRVTALTEVHTHAYAKLLRLFESFLRNLCFLLFKCVVNIVGGWLVCFVHWICIASCMSWICQCHHHYHHDKGGGVVLISLFLPFFFIFFSFLFVVLRVERGVTIKCHSFIFGVTTWFEDPSFAYDLKLG